MNERERFEANRRSFSACSRMKDAVQQAMRDYLVSVHPELAEAAEAQLDVSSSRVVREWTLASRAAASFADDCKAMYQ